MAPRFQTPKSSQDHPCCCLEPLGFGVIFYAGLHKKYNSFTSLTSLLKSQLLHEIFPGHPIKIVTHSQNSHSSSLLYLPPRTYQLLYYLTNSLSPSLLGHWLREDRGLCLVHCCIPSLRTLRTYIVGLAGSKDTPTIDLATPLLGCTHKRMEGRV